MSFLDSVKGSDEGSDEGSGEGSRAGGGGTTVSPGCFRLVFLAFGSFTPPFFWSSSACFLGKATSKSSGQGIPVLLAQFHGFHR